MLLALVPAATTADTQFKPVADIKNFVFNLPSPPPTPNFDKQVLSPLRADQAAEAIVAAQEAAQALAAQQAANLVAQQAAAAQAATQAAQTQQAQSIIYGNNYDFGNCTYYVASRVSVPSSMGNATNWDAGLSAAGWSYSLQPGSVGVSHNGYMGHVVYVEWVNGDQVGISEMNYAGFDVVDQRTVSVSDYEWLHN